MAENDFRVPVFRKALRGYSPEHVDAFIAAVQERYHSLLAENEKLRGRLSAILNENKKRGVEEEMRRHEIEEIREEAELLLEEAKTRADRLVAEAQAEKKRLMDDAIAESTRTREDAEIFAEEAKREALEMVKERDEMLSRAALSVAELKSGLISEYERALRVLEGKEELAGCAEEAPVGEESLLPTEEIADAPEMSEVSEDAEEMEQPEELEELTEEEPEEFAEEESEEFAEEEPEESAEEEPEESAKEEPEEFVEEEPKELAKEEPEEFVEEEPKELAEEESEEPTEEESGKDPVSDAYEDVASEDFVNGREGETYRDYDLDEILKGLEYMTNEADQPSVVSSGTVPEDDGDIVDALKKKFGDFPIGDGPVSGNGSDTASGDFYEDEVHEDGESFDPNSFMRFRK